MITATKKYPSMKRILLLSIVAAIFLVVPSLFLSVQSSAFSSASIASSSHFNKPGNILITDQFSNGGIEIAPQTKLIVWSVGAGNGNLGNPGPGAIIGRRDA